jgi:DNA-directed RNA polymerase specialized sigma24 family protein
VGDELEDRLENLRARLREAVKQVEALQREAGELAADLRIRLQALTSQAHRSDQQREHDHHDRPHDTPPS